MRSEYDFPRIFKELEERGYKKIESPDDINEWNHSTVDFQYLDDYADDWNLNIGDEIETETPGLFLYITGGENGYLVEHGQTIGMYYRMIGKLFTKRAFGATEYHVPAKQDDGSDWAWLAYRFDREGNYVNKTDLHHLPENWSISNGVTLDD